MTKSDSDTAETKKAADSKRSSVRKYAVPLLLIFLVAVIIVSVINTLGEDDDSTNLLRTNGDMTVGVYVNRDGSGPVPVASFQNNEQITLGINHQGDQLSTVSISTSSISGGTAFANEDLQLSESGLTYLNMGQLQSGNYITSVNDPASGASIVTINFTVGDPDDTTTQNNGIEIIDKTGTVENGIQPKE